MVRRKNTEIFLKEPMMDKTRRQGEEKENQRRGSENKHIKRMQSFYETLYFVYVVHMICSFLPVMRVNCRFDECQLHFHFDKC